MQITGTIQVIQNHVHMHVGYQNAESKRTIVRGGFPHIMK